MESVEPMDDSPEHVTQSAEDGDQIDIDYALAQDRPPSEQGGVAEPDCNDPESMVTDENVTAMNQDEGSEVSESDSEESPESPPAQSSVPMEQEYPVVDEEQSLNFRSPEQSYQAAELEGEELHGKDTEEVHRSDEEEFDRPDSNTERPESPVVVPETSDYVQEKSDSCDETPGSPQEPQLSASSPREIPYSPNEVDIPEVGGNDDSESTFDKKVGDSITDTENVDDLTLNVFGLQDNDSVKGSEDLSAVQSRRSSEGNNVDSTVNQDGEAAHHIPAEDRLQADSSVNLSPQSPEQGHRTEEPVSGPSDDSKEKDEEDIYSLDLMGDDGASNSEAVPRDSDGKTFQRFSDDLYNENKSLANQGEDVDSIVSQSGEREDASNDPHSSIHVPVEPVTGSSELSHGSPDPESNVHSTTLPHRSDRLRESIDSDSIRRVHNSSERYNVNDIPNGVAEREDELRAGRVQDQSNTSFNEEHVELDYDEEEGEDMHSHAHKEAGDGEDRHKEGSADEKQDGELSSSDEDKDDGELDDDEDCEEGEIREPGGRKPFVKPICRFYTKGNCTWGNNCRFLHPGVNDKGNYRLFETPGLNGGIMGLNRRFGQGWGPEPGAEPELPPPPPELPATESAWERGLRHAKEMRKKATMRKEQETNFEEKRMNLSLDEERDLNKENERSKFVKDPYYDQYDDDEYYGKSQIHGWQAGSYENFEVRWTREPDYQHYRHEKERERFKERHFSPPVERMERIDRLERQMFDQSPRMRDERRDKYRDDRMEPPPPPSQIPRGRADEWHDPWQRSKSPKQKRRSSRSHSRGRRRRRSYSVSSHSSSSYSSSRSRSSSFSSRSSRSSYSRSSSFSSRSPSPRATGSKKPAPHPADKNQGPPQKSGPGKRGPPIDERKVPPQSRNNTGKRVSSTDERKGPQQTKNNDQPRSAVTVKVKQRSPDKRPGGPPGKGGRPGPPGEDRGRRREKPPHGPHGPPHSRTVPRSGSRSSVSGSSFSRSRSRSSSSSSFSRSGSASSASSKSRSRSRSSSTSSSGSADSEHLYRDLHNTEGRTIPPKKKIPGRVPRENRGGPRHDHPPRRRDVDHDRDRRDERSRHDGRSGMRGNRPPHGRQATAPLKPKDPLKLVGQKSNIKLTLLNKPPEKSNLVPGGPPLKRRPTDPGSGPAPKRQALISPPGAKPPAADKPKAVPRPEKMKSPPAKDKPISPTKAPTKAAPLAGKAPAGPKQPVPGVPAIIPPPPAPAVKQKKSMSSRREELLKQLKAVEDAIARKKAKMQ